MPPFCPKCPHLLVRVALLAVTAALGCKHKGAAKPDPEPQPQVEKQAKTSCPSWQNFQSSQASAQPQTPAARVLVEIWDKLRLKHFDPTLNCLNWPALREEYLKKVQAAPSPQKAYELYNELLAKLEQSHLVAWPPASGPRTTQHNQGPARAKLHWTWHNGRVHARGARPGEAAWPSLGGEIVSIDGVALSQILAAKQEAPPPSPIEASLRVQRALSCPKGGQKRLSVQAPGASAATQVTRACVMPKAQRQSLGNLRNLETTVRAQMLRPKDKLGYLSFNVWMLPMLPQIGQEMDKLRKEGMRGLVLDLRGNRGGVASMTIPVARLFWPQGGSLGTITLRAFRQELVVRPDPQAFAGPVALLIDNQSASTTEIFALGLSAAKRVRIFGASSSAGMALASIIEGLGDGGMLQYVIGRYESPAHLEAEGSGVTPDEKVPLRVEALAGGQDPVLEAALTWLRAQKPAK